MFFIFKYINCFQYNKFEIFSNNLYMTKTFIHNFK